MLLKSDINFKNPGKLQDSYIIGDIIGSGAQGMVRAVFHPMTKQTRACKALKKTGSHCKYIMNEI